METMRGSGQHLVILSFVGTLLLAGCGPEGQSESGNEALQRAVPGALEALKNQTADGTRVRKNVKALSPKERKDFIKAVLKLKKVPSPFTAGLSYYDQFVVWHRSMYVCNPNMAMGGMGPMHSETGMGHGHGGPLFLPWHRLFLVLFEDALREVSGNKDITVPYWDWTDAQSTASVFQDDFMGGNGNPDEGFAVTSGPFRKGEWALTVQPQGIYEQPSAFPHLVRNFASVPTAAVLPAPEEVEEALSKPMYDVAPYDTTSDQSLSFRNFFEGFRDGPGQNSMVCAPDGYMVTLPLNPPKLHNAVHAWVGGILGFSPQGFPVFGTMVTSTSPNDPVFFLHHSNIDRVWAQWQARHGIHTYQPVSGFPSNNLYSHMMPFHTDQTRPARPVDVQDISLLEYRYQ
jgi:tyrosinase